MSTAVTWFSARAESFTGVDDSPAGGDGEEGPLGPSPEPQAKSDAARGAPRNGLGGGAGAAGAPSLDYKEHNRNAYCGVMCVAGRVDVNGIKVVKYVRLKCKAWSCGECGPRKARKLQKAIQGYAISSNLTRFLTLTLDPKTAPPAEECVPYIRGLWAKFRVYLARGDGVHRWDKINFISVLEYQRSGYPHLHILIDRYIPQAWIKTSWEALGGGSIVDIRRVYDLHRVAHYMGKYLTKEAILSAPAKTRRYTTSRGIQLFKKPEEPSDWWLTDYTIEQLYFWGILAVFSEEFDDDGSIFSFTATQEVRPFAW